MKEYRISGLLLALYLFLPKFANSQSIVHLANADSLNIKGNVFFTAEQYETALSIFEQVAENRRLQQGEESNDYAQALIDIGSCLSKLDSTEKALNSFLRALSIIKKEPEGNHEAATECLRKIGNCFFNLERFADALKYYQQEAVMRERIIGKENPEYASSLHRIGDCYYNLEDYSKALEYFQQALTIREVVLGVDHPDYLSNLSAVAFCLDEMGNFSSALEYYHKILACYQKLYGKNDPQCEDLLYNMGNCSYLLGFYNDAVEYYIQSLLICKHVKGSDSIDYAICLSSIVNCYLALKDYQRSLEYLFSLLTLYESLSGENSAEYALTLGGIGQCYSGLAEYNKSNSYYRRVLPFVKDEPGFYSQYLRLIGDNYESMGNFQSALDFYQQALTIQEDYSGKNDLNVAASLFGMGKCYYRNGEFSRALDFHHQSLAICEIVSGKEHPNYALSLYNIGNCYYKLRNYSKAKEFYQQSLAIREKVLGKSHPDYAQSLDGLGLVLLLNGDYVNAMEYKQQALGIRERVYGRNHPEYANNLIDIGLCYSYQREFEKAIDYTKKALDVYKSSNIEAGFGKSIGLNNIGYYYYKLKNFTTALYYFREAESFYGDINKNHPDHIRVIKNTGDCYYDMGDNSTAEKYYESLVFLTSSYLADSFSSLSNLGRDLFWGGYSDFFSNEIFEFSTEISSSAMNRTAYDCVLIGKGLLLNAEIEMRKLILSSGDEEILQMYNDFSESQVKLDRLYVDAEDNRAQIDSLNNDIEVRQQELMKRSKVFGDYTKNLVLKWTDVQASLGRKDIAIEFATYTHKDTTFYIALTLRPGYTEPHLVELFNSTQMKVKSDSKSYYTSPAMSRLVWGNLAEELNGVKNVYFSPAGELNNIGIEYMLDEDGEHLLSEKRNYYRLTSTRELAKEHQSKRMSDATVYGGIRYDVTPGSKLTGKETESERLALAATRSYTPMDSLSLTRGGWKYLPGTKEEAESISEESFKALGGARKDVIHIATHGFYWTETEAGRSGMETSSFMLDSESQAPKEDKALTRSGLLFAGAQNTFDGKEIPIDVEDGILTAKDISRMDLRGTDLVVISACQSGLGEVTGDGVFGLQRGFKKAGVQSIVMSLWEVDDTATKIMMTRFYENLAKGKSKYDSFREAQKNLRKYDKGLYDEPEYYAAFVLLDAIK